METIKTEITNKAGEGDNKEFFNDMVNRATDEIVTPEVLADGISLEEILTDEEKE